MTSITFPKQIGHKFEFVESIPMELLHSKYANHKRLRVFHHKGTQCASPGCEKIGIYLLKGKNMAGGYHVDVYTADFEMMTIDHIIPKSKGGENTLENLQPMCNKCNAKKADKDF